MRDEFPNARNISYGVNTMDFDTAGGHLTINFTEDTIVVDRKIASKAYGTDVGKGRSAAGMIEKTTRGAIITLAKEGYDRTIAHEAFHFMRQFLTRRENAALEKKYKTEEQMAEAYRHWRIERANGSGTILGKIMQKIQDYAHAIESLFHENEHNVFRKLESNQVFENGKQNAMAAHVMYQMNPMNSAMDFLKKSKAPIAKKLYQITDKKYAEALDNPNITVEEKPKKKGTWGAAKIVYANTIGSASRINDPLVKVVHGWAEQAFTTYRKKQAEWSRMHARAMEQVKSKEDQQALNSLLLEEDDKAKEYTEEELRKEGAKENVIRAHGIIRHMLHSIYKAVNETMLRPGTKTKNFETRAEAEQWAKIPFFSQQKITRQADGTYTVSVRTPPHVEIEEKEIPPSAVAEIRDKPGTYIYEDKVDSEGAHTIKAVRQLQPMADHKGYVPHLFHGWFIIAKDAEGVGHVVGSGTSVEDARKKANEMSKQEEFKGFTFTLKPKQYNFENGDVQNPILVGDKEYEQLVKSLTDSLEISLEEAKQVLPTRLNGRHIFYGAKLHRKGVEGFETNILWALQQHIATSARYVGLDPFKSRAINLYERAFGNFNGKAPNVKANFVQGYINSVIGKPGTMEKGVNALLHTIPAFKNMPRPGRQISSTITGLQSVLKLGVSPAAAIVNAFQIINAIGYLGSRATFAGLRRALHPSFQDTRLLMQLGTNEEVGLEDSAGYNAVRLTDSAADRTLQWYKKVGAKAMAGFTYADRLIRRATVLAAYYKGKANGMSEARARAYAVDINRKVNFDYSVADAPRVFRAAQGTIIGDLTLQFQKYGVKELEVLSDFLPYFGKSTTTKQKAEFFGLWLMMGGLFNALPFQDLIIGLFGALAGDDEDPEKRLKRAIMEWAGDDPSKKLMAKVAMYGIGGAGGIDISQRVGLKGLIPDTDHLSVGGVTTNTIAGIWNGLQNNDPQGILKAVSPGASNVWQAVAGFGTDSKGRKTIDYDGFDRAMKFLGFRTTDEAIAADKQSIAYSFKKSKSAERTKAKEAYYDDPSSENKAKLKALGYSDNDIKKMKNPKDQLRIDRAQSTLSKNDRKELGTVMNF